jgi:insulysin
MTVNAGFDKEDPRIPGLAHFCEHMLFLGSQRYADKKPSFFVDKVTLSGGQFNGYTDFSNTAYFYMINNKEFDESLEIFSRFFIDPLISEQYVQKEVNAVNSEFERNLGLDSRRKEMILRDTADRDSTFSRFSTGNTNTLYMNTMSLGINLREAVVEFHKKHYRPDNMKLIIYGDKDFDYYKDLVTKLFNEMPEAAAAESYDGQVNAKPPWGKENLGKIIFYETISDHQELDITIPIPDLFDILPENPALYYKLLLNYPGEDSLVDLLRHRGYAGGIKAFVRRVYKGTCFFKLRAFLTRKGLKNINLVVELIFQYINYIREKALDRELYDFIKSVHMYKFFYAHKKKHIMSTIRDLTSIMYKYPQNYYLAEHHLLPDYNETVLRSFGDNLIITNAIIMVGNKDFDSDVTQNYHTFINDFDYLNITDKRSSYYNAKFNMFGLRPDFIGSVLNAHLPELYNKQIDLYPHHEQLPTLLSLADECNKKPTELEREACKSQLRRDALDLTPCQIMKSSNYELWYKQDRSFYIARTNFFIRFHFEQNVNDIKYATQLRLLLYAFNHKLRNFFFQESLRQTSFELRANSNGFSIKIYSFSEIIQQIAGNLIQNLLSTKLNDTDFELITDEMKNQLNAQLDLDPSTQAYVNFFGLVLKDYISSKDIIKTIDGLQKADFDTFVENIYSSLYIKSFIHGTVCHDEAIQIFSTLNSLLERNPKAIDQSQIAYTNLHADLSGYYIYREQMTKEYHVNHAVLNFYQVGLESVENMFSALLIKYLVGYIYFTQLRIEEQLGYSTKARVLSDSNVIYYMIYIQGSAKTPDYMDYRIENVIELMRKRIEDTDDQKFELGKRVVTSQVSRGDYNLASRTMRYAYWFIYRLWDQIVTNENFFNVKCAYEGYAKTLTKNKLIEKFDNIFNKKLSKLSVQEFNNNPIENLMTQPVHEIPPTVIQADDLDHLRRLGKFLQKGVINTPA